MRSKRHRGRIPPVSCSNLCVFLVFVGPRPRSFVVSLLFLRRNANLAGGFAGRLVPWFFVFFLFACFAFATYFDCTAGTTTFLSPRFSLFIRITGPSLRASSAKPGEKKVTKPRCPGASSMDDMECCTLCGRQVAHHRG
jgi:hypothetical protein